MKRLFLPLFLFVSTGTASAAEWVLQIDQVDKQQCQIRLSQNGNDAIDYLNFGTQVNTYQSLTGYIPVSKRLQFDRNDKHNRKVVFTKTSYASTVSNTYSNCLSLIMKAGIPFMKKKEADTLLLKDKKEYWDVCFKHFDGLEGTCRQATTFKDKNGKEQLTMTGDEYACGYTPYSEFILVKRHTVKDSSGDYIDVDSDQNRVSLPGHPLVIEGTGSLQETFGDLKLEINCEVERQAFSDYMGHLDLGMLKIDRSK